MTGKPAPMADDALTRKEAEMTREQVCSAEFRARIIGYGAHGAAPRLTVSEAEQLCDLALRALSLESVREEALEALLKRWIAAPMREGSWDYQELKLDTERALQHAPARVAEDDKEKK